MNTKKQITDVQIEIARILTSPSLSTKKFDIKTKDAKKILHFLSLHPRELANVINNNNTQVLIIALKSLREYLRKRTAGLTYRDGSIIYEPIKFLFFVYGRK